MTEFVFNEAFRRDLRESAHQWGEVTFLETVLRPGMVVIEGGSNRGVTAVAMAKAVGETGQVYAFEPVPEYFASLQANISRNGVANISSYNLALSDQNGRMGFYKHGEGSGVAPTADSEETEVNAIALPEFLATYRIPKLDFINLDCEGSELFIFQNAADLLKQHESPIFCEVHRGYLATLGQSVQDAVGCLSTVGYHVTPIQVEDLSRPSDFEQCSHIYATI